MNQPTAIVKTLLLSLFLCCLVRKESTARQLLNRPVTFDVYRQQLPAVLEILSNKGNFYFSYNSHIIRQDTLITISVYNKTVRQVLDSLLADGYEYKESGDYIIIRKAPVKIPLVSHTSASAEKYYTVTGYILDDQTGEKISNASIYEKTQLASAITDENGYFKIKLKSRYNQASLTVSKEFYDDTTFSIQTKYNQQLLVTIMPIAFSGNTVTVAPYSYNLPDSIVIAVQKADSTHWLYTYRKTDSVMVEKTGMGKLFLSAWQRMQTINLKKFFINRPYQLSLLPGLSTNGPLNSQIVNNISLNIWGGYSTGVNGVELAGWFNITKKNVRWVQAAGWSNIVGGTVDGLQVAGLTNTVFDSVRGVQLAGIGNFVRRSFSGLQVAGIYNHINKGLRGWQAAGIGNYTNNSTRGAQLSGIYNHTGDSLTGAQVSGIGNFSNNKVVGVQLSGIINVARRDMKGVQVAGIINYAKKISGLQLGLINIADTSDGYSIGLINIILKGYHKLSLYTTEALPMNMAFKTGSKKLYSILLAGLDAQKDQKIYSYGYGLGKEFNFNKRWGLNPEITAQHLYLGTWNYINVLMRSSVQLNLKFGKYFSCFAGPSFTVYYSNQTEPVKGYRFELPYRSASKMHLANKVTGWLGYTIGMNIF